MGVKPLDYTQTLYIPGLEAFDPELSVIIVDLNYPTGQVIPIETIMAGPKAQTNGTSITKPSTLTPAGGPGPVIPIQSIPDPVEITVIYRNPFTITASTSFAYAISEKHNDFSLVLETARYEKNNVSWTYNSLQTGITDVIITTDSEISILGAPMITKTVCIINVISPVNILPVPLPEEILSFKGRVVIAQRLVQEQYKSAALVCVDVKTPSPVPVTDPLRLSYMRCVFVVENGPPVEYTSFNIEDCVDITTAVEDMHKEGTTGAFFNAELTATELQRYYVFAMRTARPRMWMQIRGA